jgi:hypothetical protein
MKDHASAINGKIMEEVPPLSPAVIQSSNSHLTEASNNYTEDVNFQYMRSVLFKFITTSDPQVVNDKQPICRFLLDINIGIFLHRRSTLRKPLLPSCI